MTLITRFDPWKDVVDFRERMNRMFPEFAREAEEPYVAANWSPVCDIVETKDAILVKAELPGIKPEDVNVEVNDGVLTLRGERSFEKETKEKNYRRIERSYGNFVRSFTLPRNVDAEKVKAKFDEGILEIELPKTEEAKPKQIKITGKMEKLPGKAA